MLFAVKSPNSSDMLLYVQANLPKTSPFSPAQMTVLSIFFQAFIVLGMYNFVFPLAPSITKIEFVQKIVMDTKEETTAQATP